MPFATDTILAESHLSTEEIGAYVLILATTWRNDGEPLPDDEIRLARITRLSVARWRKIRPALAPLFDLSGGTWRSAQLERDFEKALEKSGKQSAKAKRRWEANALKSNNTADAAASAVAPSAAMPSKYRDIGQREIQESESPDSNPKTENHDSHSAPSRALVSVEGREVSSKRRESDEAQGAAEFWKIYPRKVGKPAAIKKFVAIVKKGEATIAEILDGARRYAAAVAGGDPKYIAHPLTWLNHGRWSDDPAAIAGRRSGGAFDAPFEKRLREIERGNSPEILDLKIER